MIAFIFQRLLLAVPTLFVVLLLAFGLTHLAPGDVAVFIAGGLDARPERIAEVQAQLGLDRPFLVQFWDWLQGVLTRGDLGDSVLSSFSVWELIWSALPVSASIALGALVFSIIVAMATGYLAALHSGSWLDRLTNNAVILGIALPNFLVGLLLVLVVSLNWGLLPATGYSPLSEGFWPWLQTIILPSLALGSAMSAELSKHVREALSEVLAQDYIRSAVANGANRSRTLIRHGLKPAALPIITVMGLQVRNIIGATVTVEAVFGLNGVGSLAVSAAIHRDIPVVQGVLVLAVITVIVSNIITDSLYGFLDPRVRT